jgi:putative DNA primase/helicase
MEDQNALKQDLTWHQQRLLRQRQQSYESRDENKPYSADYEDEPRPEPDYEDAPRPEPDLLKFRQNDVGNAKRFLALHWGFVRYCAARKEWLIFSGNAWRFSNLLAVRLAAQAMILFTEQAGENYDRDLLRFAVRSQNARQLTALLEVARSFPGVDIELSELDANPYFLGCPNGYLDLQTQKLYRPRPEDLITKTINVNFDASAECPIWLATLEEALEPEMIPYLQKIFGLCLSGDVRHKAFFLFHGVKNAGKTQILNTIRRILGPYAGLLSAETLTSRTRGSNASADLAQLAGMRFAQTSELDSKLVARVMKSLVQGTGSEIKACLKYGNPVRVRESWKVFVDTNELPNLEDPDDTAFLDRVHPIRFRHSVSPEKMDKDLPAKLEVELPGILGWMAKGFARLQTEGLEKPATVIADLNQWQKKSDNVLVFVESCCAAADGSSVPAQSLYKRYQAWCTQSLKSPISPPFFSQRVGRHYRKQRTKKGLFYIGLRLV